MATLINKKPSLSKMIIRTRGSTGSSPLDKRKPLRSTHWRHGLYTWWGAVKHRIGVLEMSFVQTPCTNWVFRILVTNVQFTGRV